MFALVFVVEAAGRGGGTGSREQGTDHLPRGVRTGRFDRAWPGERLSCWMTLRE
jgi:hypothetical protein